MTKRTLRSDKINDALRDHAVSLGDWPHRKIVDLLHEWALRFNQEFRLSLHTPVIALDQLPVRRFAAYQPGRNRLGLRHEITFNTRHFDRPLAEVLCALLHELLHAWQELFGKGGRRNYHNEEFRVMARRFGLMIDDRGRNLGIEPGPFTRLLAQYRVDISTLSFYDEQSTQKIVPEGNPKLRKYSCLCTNVRCATELVARCDRCGARFRETPPNYKVLVKPKNI